MPRLAKPLSDAQVKRAKAATKLVKLFDGHGLYLEVHPTGGRFMDKAPLGLPPPRRTLSIGMMFLSEVLHGT